MAQSMLSNLSFKLAGVLLPTGSSVKVSNDLERNQVITATGASVVIKNLSGSSVERMVCNFAGGVMTITQRGLDQSETKTTDVSLQKEWRVGAIGYITVLASDMLDIDNAAGASNIYPNINFHGDNNFYGDNGHYGIDIFEDLKATQKFRLPAFADETARDAIYTSPVNGDKCILAGDEQHYNGVTGQWETLDVGTPTPNASEIEAGKVQAATTAETLAGTDIGSTGALLFPHPSDIKTNIASAVVTAQNLSIVSLTAGENITIGDNLCYKNTEASESITHATQNTDPALGTTTSCNIGQLITLSSTGYLQKISSIMFPLLKVGAPTDNISVSIYNDDLVTIIETSSNVIAGTALSTSSATDCTFNFSTNVLIPGKTYYAVIRRSGAEDNTNYYKAYYNTAGDLTNAYVFDGTTRTSAGASRQMKSTVSITTYTIDPTTVMKMDANDPLKIQDAGIATETKTAGQTVKVQMSGVVAGVSTGSNSTVDTHTNAWDTTGIAFDSYGYKITTNFACLLNQVTKSSLCTATRAILRDSGGTSLATATFVGDVATFTPYSLSNGTTYRVEVDNNGLIYNYRGKDSDANYPDNKTNINYVGGSDAGVDRALTDYNIVSILTTRLGTNLTPNLYYYASDTAGSLSTTPSTTYNIRIGKAISATQLLIDKKKIYNTTRTFVLLDQKYNGGTVYYDYPFSNKYIRFYTGFRPTKIRIDATCIGATYLPSIGYSDGVINKFVGGAVTVSGGSTTLAFRTLYRNDNSNQLLSGTINFLNNGFEIYYTKANGANAEFDGNCNLFFDIE